MSPTLTRPLVIVFSRAPIPGHVKTRLGLDSRQAIDVHSALLTDTLAAVGTISETADTELSTDVPTDAWPEIAVTRSVQVEGDLGQRMYAALARALASPREKAMIIGSDSPMLPHDHLYSLLKSAADVAIGPTEDGGYYAIACGKVSPGMFDGVRWSTPSTLEDTVKAAKRCGLTVELGARWFDVDRSEDLERLRHLLLRRPECPRAARLLRSIPPRPSGAPFFLDPNDVQNLNAHLRELSWLDDEQVLSAERIGDGNMNLTVRVRTEHQTFVLKQARSWVEKYPYIPAPPERATVEAAFYRIVAAVPTVTRRMPKLLGFDSTARLLCFADLGERADMTGLYLGGSLAEDDCRRLTVYLSDLHEVHVPAEDVDILRNRSMRSLNHEHQYDFPLTGNNGLDLDRITPGLADEAGNLMLDEEYCAIVADLGRRYLADGPMLVHGDFFPGSWLQTDHGPAVIDTEFSFLGCREYDLGVFLAHLVLISSQSLWCLVERDYAGDVDWELVRRFAGAEIMRRLIGVAQLPVPADLALKREWLKISRRLVCGS